MPYSAFLITLSRLGMQRSPLPLVEHIIPHLSQAHYIRASGKGLFRSVASAKERPGRSLHACENLSAGEFRAKNPRPGEAFRVELLSLPVGWALPLLLLLAGNLYTRELLWAGQLRSVCPIQRKPDIATQKRRLRPQGVWYDSTTERKCNRARLSLSMLNEMQPTPDCWLGGRTNIRVSPFFVMWAEAFLG